MVVGNIAFSLAFVRMLLMFAKLHLLSDSLSDVVVDSMVMV